MTRETIAWAVVALCVSVIFALAWSNGSLQGEKTVYRKVAVEKCWQTQAPFTERRYRNGAIVWKEE